MEFYSIICIIGHRPDILPSARRGFHQVIADVELSGIIAQMRNQQPVRLPAEFRVRSSDPKNVWYRLQRDKLPTECWFPDILP